IETAGLADRGIDAMNRDPELPRDLLTVFALGPEDQDFFTVSLLPTRMRGLLARCQPRFPQNLPDRIWAGVEYAGDAGGRYPFRLVGEDLRGLLLHLPEARHPQCPDQIGVLLPNRLPLFLRRRPHDPDLPGPRLALPRARGCISFRR